MKRSGMRNLLIDDEVSRRSFLTPRNDGKCKSAKTALIPYTILVLSQPCFNITA